MVTSEMTMPKSLVTNVNLDHQDINTSGTRTVYTRMYFIHGNSNILIGNMETIGVERNMLKRISYSSIKTAYPWKYQH